MNAADALGVARQADELIEAVGGVYDEAGEALGALQRLRERLERAVALVPASVRTFAVTDEDVEVCEVGARAVPFPTNPVRRVLEVFAARLAERTQAGGPEVTDEDLAASYEVIQATDGVHSAMRTVLEHDRARVWARTGGAA